MSAPTKEELKRLLREQADANFLAGIEVGVRCAEKGMNLQAALTFGKKSTELFPQRNYPTKGEPK